MDGQPCKALSCSFAHSELEAELWQMDREEQLDIIEFIREQRQLRNTGQTFVPVQQPQKAVPVTPTPKVLSTQALEAAAPFAFPMRKTHEFRITCGGCIAPTLDGKAFAMRQLPEHKCRQDVLLVRPKGASAWHRVRSRQKHRPFKGKYRMCFRMGCTGSDACQYAHNDEERFLWTQEKDGEFNVDEFLISNRLMSLVPQLKTSLIFSPFQGITFRASGHHSRCAPKASWSIQLPLQSLFLRLSLTHQLAVESTLHFWPFVGSK